VRLATQAKVAGTYLTYADLGYLLGIHAEAISRLVKASPAVVVPLKGKFLRYRTGYYPTERKNNHKYMHKQDKLYGDTGTCKIY